jgi:ribonucleotide reductase beta subunit family protein with ferritin-like domain
VWEGYTKAKAVFSWTSESVTLENDLAKLSHTSLAERNLIFNIHAFFVVGDALVGETVGTFFLRRIKVAEILAMLKIIQTNELVHWESYSKSIEVLVRDPEQKEELYDSPQRSKAIAAKMAWMSKWSLGPDGERDVDHMDPKRFPLGEAFLAQVASEGIFFQASFAIIFYFKKNNKFIDLASLNEYIARDENIHCEWYLFLYEMYIKRKLPESFIHEMFREAVEIEEIFVDEMMSGIETEIDGLTPGLIKQYVRFVANFWLARLNLSPLYPNVENPFDWMDLLTVNGKTNFFEKHVSEYTKNLGFSKKDIDVSAILSGREDQF